ncbi:hypothetical protein G4B88_021758 [Cannabis sativa]|uniref:Uncharacterized protein n=1 Tax=Cannabis sativa TaxID=3483 RepID=A0A7J6EYX4_CANSA|nr:hypothetical protein G4B88_021758 [Cannabis sativa]
MAIPIRLSVPSTTKISLPRSSVLASLTTTPPKANLKFNPFSGYSTLTLFISNPTFHRNHSRSLRPSRNTAIRCLFTGIVEEMGQTSLAELSTGSLVNLERAVQPTSRMGGHFVQGHVDGT